MPFFLYRTRAAQSWWERSPYAPDAKSFCNVGSNGAAGYYGTASNAYGVAFGFCV